MTRNYIEVIGHIWMPQTTAAMRYDLREYDLSNIRDEGAGETTREDIESWLGSNSGDFQCIDDFYAVIDGVEYPWEHEDSEWTFSDCMYGSEE